MENRIELILIEQNFATTCSCKYVSNYCTIIIFLGRNYYLNILIYSVHIKFCGPNFKILHSHCVCKCWPVNNSSCRYVLMYLHVRHPVSSYNGSLAIAIDWKLKISYFRFNEATIIMIYMIQRVTLNKCIFFESYLHFHIMNSYGSHVALAGVRKLWSTIFEWHLQEQNSIRIKKTFNYCTSC